MEQAAALWNSVVAQSVFRSWDLHQRGASFPGGCAQLFDDDLLGELCQIMEARFDGLQAWSGTNDVKSSLCR